MTTVAHHTATLTGRPIAPAAPRPNWQDYAACNGTDPDLFFPEPDTSPEDVAEAKAICMRCPVRQDCLDAALRSGERAGICGGLTSDEREELLNPGARGKYRDRRANQISAREVAMNHGADMLVWLVKRQMSVEDVAFRLSVKPAVVYQAWVILVPARRDRPTVPSVIERLLAESQYSLATLARLGRTHQSIAEALGTSQNIVSSALRVLDQRAEALRRVSRRSPEVRMQLIQDAETRVRREARVGLTSQDIIEAFGVQMLRLRAEGMTMREVAATLGINRESIRRAFGDMSKNRGGRTLTRDDLRSAA